MVEFEHASLDRPSWCLDYYLSWFGMKRDRRGETGETKMKKTELIWEQKQVEFNISCASHLKGIADRKWINDSPARMLRVSCVELTRQCSHKITLSLMKDGCMQLQVIGTHRSSLPSELVCGKHCSSQVKGAPVASKLKVHGEHYFTSLSGRSSLSRV